MTFSESRTVVLQNLRSARMEKKDSDAVAEKISFGAGLSIDQSRLQNDFKANLEMVSGEVHILGEKESLTGKINGILRETGVRSVSFWNMEPLKSLEFASEPDPAGADAGITGADFAIADTGTLVLLSGPKQPRLTSLLPPVHVAILDRKNIVPDIHSLFAKLGELYGDYDELCSCISFITGPSRTADIELNLTLGVHGPGRTIVLIV